MKYDPTIHHRRSIRLPEYDYSSVGAYFVTICSLNRACLLEDPVIPGIILDVWQALPGWFPTIELDDFVLMPNHVHFIVWLQSNVRATPVVAQYNVGATLTVAQAAGASPAPTDWIVPRPGKVNLHPTLGEVVGTFKSVVFTVYQDWLEAHQVNRRAKIWQKNYYEHVIRHDTELNAIRQYIRDNPRRWAEDRDNLDNRKRLPPPSSAEDYLEDIEQLSAARFNARGSHDAPSSRT